MILGTIHVTARFFVFSAQRRLMKKLQDPVLTVPGTSSFESDGAPLIEFNVRRLH